MERRISPLGLALMSLGVFPPLVEYPRGHLSQPHPDFRPPLSPDEIADIGARMRVIAPAPKRQKYELRPLAERKERRRKRKQRRNR